MRLGKEGLSPSPSLLCALVATAAVVLLPAALVALGITLMAVHPPVVVTAILVGLVSAATASVGTALWLRHPASSACTFGELMLWTWIRRKRAERRVARELSALYQKADDVRRARQLSRNEKLDLLRSLSFSLEEKDPYLHGHSKRVERLVARTAIELRLPQERIEEVRQAASLHDVGKVQTPDRILRKPGALTIEERAVIEEHVEVGAQMVGRVARRDIVDAVRHHHERWDGRGYPDGLAGYDIPLFARIIAVADTFDAMTSDRPYRASYDSASAIEEIQLEAGAQFDPNVVEAFLRALPARSKVSHALMTLLFGKVLRNAFSWGRRTSLQNVGPAVAAAGAAAVIGLSGIGGSLPADAAKPRRVDRARAEMTEHVEPVVVASGSDVLTALAPRGHREAETRRTQPRSRKGTQKGTARTGLAVHLDDALEGARGSSGGRLRIDPDAGSETPAPAPTPARPEGRNGPGHVPGTDPQPERGRDCAGHPEGGRRAGNLQRCTGGIAQKV